MIRFEQSSVSEDQVNFHVTGLTKNRTYEVVLRSPSGEDLAETFPITNRTDSTVNAARALEGQPRGTYELRVFRLDPTGAADPELVESLEFDFLPPKEQTDDTAKPQEVRLARTASVPTPDEQLTQAILVGTRRRLFAQYQDFVEERLTRPQVLAPDAYDRLVDLTREFLAGATWRTIVDPGGRFLRNGVLPYVDTVARRYRDVVAPPGVPASISDLDPRILDQPMPVELIWSYWQEEGGLVQSLNLILARFQNRRTGGGPDPLARFDLHPLRPLRNLLWTFAEREISRITVRRRAAEYQFEYGLDLIGRAVPGRTLYVERRSRFLESFHTLLHEAHAFFRLDDDTTVVADAFPVLNALRDTHLVLAEGAENQFGDLPTEARAQMMLMQLILSQPEMRDFLGGRPMVPYEEAWMDRVDTMKTLYGWSPATISHFHELAVQGEDLLLTIRWGNWNDSGLDASSAANWARSLRKQIQRYVHAYRAVTGVDLVEAVDTTMPALLLSERTTAKARRA